MQRIFKYGNIQNIILTPDKELNVLIYNKHVELLLKYEKVIHF